MSVQAIGARCAAICATIVVFGAAALFQPARSIAQQPQGQGQGEGQAPAGSQKTPAPEPPRTVIPRADDDLLQRIKQIKSISSKASGCKDGICVLNNDCSVWTPLLSNLEEQEYASILMAARLKDYIDLYAKHQKQLIKNSLKTDMRKDRMFRIIAIRDLYYNFSKGMMSAASVFDFIVNYKEAVDGYAKKGVDGTVNVDSDKIAEFEKHLKGHVAQLEQLQTLYEIWSKDPQKKKEVTPKLNAALKKIATLRKDAESVANDMATLQKALADKEVSFWKSKGGVKALGSLSYKALDYIFTAQAKSQDLWLLRLIDDQAAETATLATVAEDIARIRRRWDLVLRLRNALAQARRDMGTCLTLADCAAPPGARRPAAGATVTDKIRKLEARLAALGPKMEPALQAFMALKIATPDMVRFTLGHPGHYEPRETVSVRYDFPACVDPKSPIVLAVSGGLLEPPEMRWGPSPKGAFSRAASSFPGRYRFELLSHKIDRRILGASRSFRVCDEDGQDLDCGPQLGLITGKEGYKIEVEARGVYDQEWPQMALYVDDTKFGQVFVEHDTFAIYTFEGPPLENPKTISLHYIKNLSAGPVKNRSLEIKAVESGTISLDPKKARHFKEDGSEFSGDGRLNDPGKLVFKVPQR